MLSRLFDDHGKRPQHSMLCTRRSLCMPAFQESSPSQLRCRRAGDLSRELKRVNQPASLRAQPSTDASKQAPSKQTDRQPAEAAPLTVELLCVPRIVLHASTLCAASQRRVGEVARDRVRDEDSPAHRRCRRLVLLMWRSAAMGDRQVSSSAASGETGERCNSKRHKASILRTVMTCKMLCSSSHGQQKEFEHARVPRGPRLGPHTGH